jgi:hypothetical protein
VALSLLAIPASAIFSESTNRKARMLFVSFRQRMTDAALVGTGVEFERFEADDLLLGFRHAVHRRVMGELHRALESTGGSSSSSSSSSSSTLSTVFDDVFLTDEGKGDLEDTVEASDVRV